MKMRLPVGMRALVAACVLLMASGQADAATYPFIGDFDQAVRRLLSDMRGARVDLSDFSPAAIAALKNASGGTMRFEAIERVGALDAICPNLELEFPNGRTYAFRTKHERGSWEWIIRASGRPERIEMVLFFPVLGRAPGILPPYQPSEGQSLQPPPNLGCTKAVSRPAGSAETAEACSRWPRMCAP